MAHKVETMAFANEVPWHGLGNRVDPTVSVDEMLVAAGLNWEVEQHECYAEIGGQKVAVGRQALVRSTDNRVLTITGDAWKPLQNRDALEFFREYTEAGGAKLETAGSLREGKVVWGLASIQKGFSLQGRDQVNGYLLLVSPHEVGKAIQVRHTAVRVVCANTMAMAERSGTVEYKQNHLKEFDIEAAKAAVALGAEAIAKLEMEARALQKLKMSEYDTVRVLADYFMPASGDDAATEKAREDYVKTLVNEPSNQSKVLKELLLSVNKAPGATPGNGWGVLNGVTHWADHVAGRTNDARLYRSWFGHTGQAKTTVKRTLLEMADYEDA